MEGLHLPALLLYRLSLCLCLSLHPLHVLVQVLLARQLPLPNPMLRWPLTEWQNQSLLCLGAAYL